MASAWVLLCYINHLATPTKLQEIGIIVRPSPQSRNKNAFKSVEKPFSENVKRFFFFESLTTQMTSGYDYAKLFKSISQLPQNGSVLAYLCGQPLGQEI